MDKKRLRDREWYPTAAAICVGVVLYILLSRFQGIWGGVKTFVGFFKPVILGCVIAYIVNPLARLLERLLKGVQKEGLRKTLSVILAFALVILILLFSAAFLIPQLIESIETFIGNLDGYIESVNAMLDKWGIAKSTFDLSTVVSSSESLLADISKMITDNAENVLGFVATTGKSLLAWAIAFILAIYLMLEKPRLKVGGKRLLTAIFGEKRYSGLREFLHKCDEICSRYIVFNLIDCLIVGLTNAAFMLICGMEYVGLTSFVVAITNLIPTFGPVIGAVIGGFVLLMVNPMHALMFLVFTMVLQIFDGYILKPRLFGNSLGVSGLWILIGVVVGGNMFGVVGILLAIPAVAILDLIYRSYLIPALERRRGIMEKPETGGEEKAE